MNYSNSPSFNSGSWANLGGLGATAYDTFVDSSGVTKVVMQDNSVYSLDDTTGVLTLDPDLTATFRQIDSVSPGSVQQTIGGTSGFDFNSVLNNLSSMVTTLVTANAQRQLLQTNLTRAAQGLPPLNAQSYMPGVNVGLASGTQNMVYIVAAGLGAVLLLNMFSGGKKRR